MVQLPVGAGEGAVSQETSGVAGTGNRHKGTAKVPVPASLLINQEGMNTYSKALYNG